MDIKSHPIWENIAPYKKYAHILRIYLAKHVAKLYPRSLYIGVTGSVGKTSTVKCCLAVLSQKFSTIATSQNLDPILNIPITLLKLRPRIKKVILEMGVEYPGEMDFYLSLVAPATGIVTRVSFAHSQFLGGIDQIFEEKSKLIASLPKDGLAILNYDDPNTRKMATLTQAKVLFYGTDQQNCDVWAGNIRIENFQTKFELNCGVERVEVELKLLGKHQAYPALAAAALGISYNLSLITIKKGLESVEGALHRLEACEGVSGAIILDDTYNSSPAALEESLNVLQQLPARKRVAVLGEMRELGDFSEKLHRIAAQKIYKDKLDQVLLGSGDAKYIADELIRLGYSEDRIHYNLTNSQLVSRILSSCSRGDVVLIKASRAVRFDEVVRRVTKQIR